MKPKKNWKLTKPWNKPRLLTLVRSNDVAEFILGGCKVAGDPYSLTPNNAQITCKGPTTMNCTNCSIAAGS